MVHELLTLNIVRPFDFLKSFYLFQLIFEHSLKGKSCNSLLESCTCQQPVFKAIFSNMQDGLTYIFSKDKFWRITKNYEADKGYPKNISEKWHGIPDDFDEVFVWGENWNTYFFKVKN